MTDGGSPQQIKRVLNSEDGVRYYEQYLGRAKTSNSVHLHANIFVYLGVFVLVTATITFVCQLAWQRLRLEGPRESITVDCEKAILKKQRLEQSTRK